jgi:hypothetical protein
MVENYDDSKRLAAVMWNVNFVGGFDYSHGNELKVEKSTKEKEMFWMRYVHLGTFPIR